MSRSWLDRITQDVREHLGANDTEAGLVLDDHHVNHFAELDLLQRVAWARELGLDPRTADLLSLPPVARAAARQRAA